MKRMRTAVNPMCLSLSEVGSDAATPLPAEAHTSERESLGH